MYEMKVKHKIFKIITTDDKNSNPFKYNKTLKTNKRWLYNKSEEKKYFCVLLLYVMFIHVYYYLQGYHILLKDKNAKNTKK